MSDGKIERRWELIREESRSALVVYLTAGYPTPDTTVAALRMVQEAGADFIELGLSFSDPLADGPIIQRASFHALAGGITVERALDSVKEADLDVPVVAFSYLNPILRYGPERFLDRAARCGVSGLLITDLPAGSDPPLEARLGSGSLDRIQLVAPTTRPERVREICREARGFLYLIARLGVTGQSTRVGPDTLDMIARVKRECTLPLVIGFGIRTAAQVESLAAAAEGIVVGSAVVEALGVSLDAARELVRSLRGALDGAARV